MLDRLLPRAAEVEEDTVIKRNVVHIKIGQPLEVQYRDVGGQTLAVDRVWAYGGAVKVDVTELVKVSAIIWQQIFEAMLKAVRA